MSTLQPEEKRRSSGHATVDRCERENIRRDARSKRCERGEAEPSDEGDLRGLDHSEIYCKRLPHPSPHYFPPGGRYWCWENGGLLGGFRNSASSSLCDAQAYPSRLTAWPEGFLSLSSVCEVPTPLSHTRRLCPP